MRAIFGGMVGLALVGAMSTASAAQGVLLVERTTVGGSSTTNQVRIAGGRMRADVTDAASGRQEAIIFDAAKQVIDIVNLQQKTYMEMTKAEMEQMASQMQGVMSQMQTALASMPPAQRAQMEAMMRGRGMGAAGAAPATEYRKAGSDHAGRWTCDRYEGYQNGQKVSEVCTVDPDTLGLSAGDVATVRQLGEFFKALVPSLVPKGAGVLEVGAGGAQGFSGIPVRMSMTAGGRDVTTELTDVSRKEFADTLFTVPAGFEKQAFPSMGRRGQ